jgi:hypothetical protein
MQKKNGAQKKLEEYANQAFDMSGGCHGNPQAYGVFHYLDDSLFNNPSCPMKKHHHRTLSDLFSRVNDIRGHKSKYACYHKTPK